MFIAYKAYRKRQNAGNRASVHVILSGLIKFIDELLGAPAGEVCRSTPGGSGQPGAVRQGGLRRGERGHLLRETLLGGENSPPPPPST